MPNIGWHPTEEQRARLRAGWAGRRAREVDFWSHVDATGDCWEWTAYRNPAGYGHFTKKYAHRVAYETLVGPIPAGLQIDHLCRNTSCVNPDHLEPVTPRENTLRSPASRPRQCPQGHPRTPETRYRLKDGRMGECKACCANRRRRAA